MRKLSPFFLCLTLFAAAPVHAVNMQWLMYSPIRCYTDEDWKHYQAAVDQALNTGKDGETVEWQNPRTGAAGEVTVVKTLRAKSRNLHCRLLKLRHRLRNLKGETQHWFCKQENGDWLVTDASQIKQALP